MLHQWMKCLVSEETVVLLASVSKFNLADKDQIKTMWRVCTVISLGFQLNPHQLIKLVHIVQIYTAVR